MPKLFDREVSNRLFNRVEDWMVLEKYLTITSQCFRDYVCSDAFPRQKNVGRGTVMEAREIADDLLNDLVHAGSVSVLARINAPIEVGPGFGQLEVLPEFKLDPESLEPVVVGDSISAARRFWKNMDEVQPSSRWKVTFTSDAGSITVNHHGTVTVGAPLLLSPEAADFWNKVRSARQEEA